VGVSRASPILGVPRIISRTGKPTDVKFGRYIYRVHRSKSPLKTFEKRDRGRIQGLPNFGDTPIISGTGKATDFKFGRYIDRVYVNKSPLKTSGTVAICVVRESCTFSGHPYIGRIARLSLRQHGFLVNFLSQLCDLANALLRPMAISRPLPVCPSVTCSVSVCKES